MNTPSINVDYSTTIPNNVGLTEDRRVLKALEVWHPGYLSWWNDMGPEGFQEKLVYLRTAVSVDPGDDPALVLIRISYVHLRNNQPGNLVFPFYLE